VSETFHVRPRSVVRSTRAFDVAPVPIHAWVFPLTAILVPLAANAPSFSSAGGKALAGTRFQICPPFSVVIIQNRLSIESPMTMP